MPPATGTERDDRASPDREDRIEEVRGDGEGDLVTRGRTIMPAREVSVQTRHSRVWTTLAAAVVAAMALTGCEESVFDVEDFGEIQYDLELAGSPAEDSDGFRIEWRHREIDDATGSRVFAAGFLSGTLDNVPAGPVDVELTEVPRNCSVSDATRSVDVPVDGSVSVAFSVACT